MTTPDSSDDLAGRGATVAAIILFYAGVYLTDKEQALTLMADDETLGELLPSDAQVGVLMACEMFAAAADLDADDVREMAKAAIEAMVTGP